MKKDINLFYVYEKDSKEPVGRARMLIYSVLAIMLLINAVSIGTFFIMNVIDKNKISKLETFFDQPAVIENIARQKETGTKISKVEHDVQVMKAVEVYLEDIPKFKTDMYEKVVSVKPANVNIISFSYAEDTININCTTTDNMPPADYTKALEYTGIFESVIYRGFNESGENTVLFPITCRLKAGVYE